MSFNYLDLVNFVESEVQNSADSVNPSLRTVLNNAILFEITDFDYKSLQRHTRTFQTLHDQVFRYSIPADMADEALIDIQKYGDFDTGSYVNYTKVDQRAWFSNKSSQTFAFDYDTSLKWLLFYPYVTTATRTLATMNSLTENGTWTAADDGTSIVLNKSNFISGSSAIQITNTGTQNSIVNSTLSSIDITDTTFAFIWVYLPSTDNLSNITLRYGSDSSNYYQASATSPFNLDEFQTGWNLIGVDRSSETTTGSPIQTAIDYIKVSANYAAASSDDIVFDNIVFSIGQGYDLLYYSRYPWRDTSGTWKELSTVDSDILNADSEEFKVLGLRCAFEVASKIPLSADEIQTIFTKYDIARTNYKRKFPSMRKKQRSYC